MIVISETCFNSFVVFIKTKIELYAQHFFSLSNRKVILNSLFCNNELTVRFYSQLLRSLKRVYIKKQTKQCSLVILSTFDRAQMKLSTFKPRFEVLSLLGSKCFRALMPIHLIALIQMFSASRDSKISERARSPLSSATVICC